MVSLSLRALCQGSEYGPAWRPYRAAPWHAICGTRHAVLDAASPVRRAYDHRIRRAVVASGNPHLFPVLRIPDSTARTWIARGERRVDSFDTTCDAELELHAKVARLQRELAVLQAVVVLLVALVRAFGLRLHYDRIPSACDKRVLLTAIDRARRTMPLSAALRVLRLSTSRYHAWQGAALRCALDDHTTCPKSSPARAAATEVAIIKDMVTSDAYRHMPVATLAKFAQRAGRVFLSQSTWQRLVRRRGWRRPRFRLYPAKPTLGVRAAKANELWHVDTTAIRLLDGSRVFICAVIDNFSRMILAWDVAPKLSPLLACNVLAQADKHLPGAAAVHPTLLSDSGTEYVNADVKGLLQQRGLKHVLAQVEVAYSNSMIEAFWRSLKHGWLYLNALDTEATVRKHMAFFVEQHNTVMPHSAFAGPTPVEMFRGEGPEVTAQLAGARKLAREQRHAHNRLVRCDRCPHPSSASPPHTTSPPPR